MGFKVWTLAAALAGFLLVVYVEAQTKYNDLDTWDPPAEFKKKLPYYIAGYDNEDKPVLVWEYGKWDSHKYIAAGGETEATYKKYVAQFWNRLGSLKSPKADAPTGVLLIMDAEGLDNSRLANPQLLSFILEQARQFNDVADNIDKFYILNANFIAQTLINLVKPAAGRVLEKVEIFGTNKERWLPRLQKDIPKDQLPTWYGGTKDYKPVTVYGR